MLSRQLLTRRLPQVATTSRFAVPRAAFSEARALRATVEDEDPHLNGNYPNPPAIKRQFRDPNGQWWDKQERRNFGEPIHEDNDILGVFSPEQYNHVTSKKAFLSIGTFVAGFLGFCGLVSMYYPDKPSTPRTFPNGLEKELGGTEAVPARKAGEDTW
ncbi:NADH dehydrogenase (ubiquinone) 1 beta subcomplex 8 [Talaromyces islandicus]|uniref:NADH dehydrogenase (Ubiquinone) 1 beta subcomplex 8 n=1 Tax=Talaromyces islandicus TaxID=28573 RepID=A0A0U1M912_TALIS|nr:NADH dehydrogenase (ubiquinone) 1 beta subcomplex 8 [Talaromyces islandicus]